MSDRNPNQPFQPREAERYAELADLMGNFEANTQVVERHANLDLTTGGSESGSLESALAAVDANYPIRPRELPISTPAMSRTWQAAPGSIASTAPVAAPLAPQALDAWDLRPTHNPIAQAAAETTLPRSEVTPALATPEVWPDEYAAHEAEPSLESLDEDAFQSVLEGLEGDILGDDELNEFAQPIVNEFVAEVPPEPFAASTFSTNSYQPQHQPIDAQVAAPVDEINEFDPNDNFDAVFQDEFEETADRPVTTQTFIEPEFEDIDFGDKTSLAVTPIDPTLGIPAGAGMAAVLGSMRANASRETQSVAATLPATAPIVAKANSNSEPLFVDTALPYDDVPVTGSLKVPDFVASEAVLLDRPTLYDDFEVEDFQPVPAQTQSNSKHHTDVPLENSFASEEDFAEVDFADAFDKDFSPTDELADLVGSNVEPDRTITLSKNDDFAPMPPLPMAVRPKSSRGKWLAVGAFGLAIFGALAIYGSSGDAVNNGAEPAIVRADNDPVRVAPDNPGGTVVPNQDRVVFNEVGGNAVPEQPQENLVDGRQEPAIAAAPVKEEDRVLNGDITAEPTGDGGAAIAPRAVQTVIVRPDGTLVVNEPAAPVAAAPQAEVVPETRPEAEAAEQSMPAPTVAEAAGTQEAQTPITESSATDAPLKEIAEAQVAPKVPVRVVEIKPVTQKPKVKAQQTQPAEALEAVPSRPSDQPVNIVNPEAPAVPETPPETPAQQQTAAANPAPQADALAAGSYAIQIASTSSEEAATSTLRSLSSKFGSILGGKDYAIQRAEVPGKGIMYRVRILAGSKADAGKLCSRYKSAGGSCFVTR